jgi:hypothetical protein
MRVYRFAAILMFAAIRNSSSQESTGDLRGRITSAGAPMTGVTVEVAGLTHTAHRTTRTSRDGVFNVSGLSPGAYALHLNAIGLRPVEIPSVTIELGRTTGLADIHVVPAQTQLAPVIIEATTTLDPVRTTVGGLLSAAQLDAIPEDRDYKSFMSVVPHVNVSFNGDAPNSAGSTGLENMYYIDGVNVTSPFVEQGGTRLPYNFVQAVEVRSGGYQAGFGRALGAIVNAVTYTGTNAYESSGFAFFGGSSLSATPRSRATLEESGSYSYDVGARVGGPIVRDHLWYSAAYNPRVTSATRTITGLGTFPDHSRTDIFVAKATWMPRASTTAEFLAIGDPSIHHAVEPSPYQSQRPLTADPYLQLSKSGGVAASMRIATSLGSSGFLNASLSRSTARNVLVGDSPAARNEIPFVDESAGTLSGGMIYPSAGDGMRTTAAVQTTMTRGAHEAHVGAEYEDVFISTRGSPAQSVLRKFSADSFELTTVRSVGAFHNRTPAGFIDDAWRVSDRFTIEAGARWSRQRFSSVGVGEGQHFDGEWQPRVGFSLLLGSRGAGRVFGSIGRYYQELPVSLAVQYLADFSDTIDVYRADPRKGGATPIARINYSTPASWYLKSDAKAGGDRYDEATLGYEHFTPRGLVTVRGMYRTLRTAFAQGINPDSSQFFFIGTPGQGDLAFLPRARRDYAALEASWRGGWNRLSATSSYVLSRTWGNYPGQFGSDVYVANAGIDFGLNLREQARNSTGALPNDRRHVFKTTGSYMTSSAMQVGWFATWQSGTPLNEFGVTPWGSYYPVFLVPRGSAGRTPSVYDVNLRTTYLFRAMPGAPRAIVDLLHVGNPQRAVRMDQLHYRESDASGDPVPTSKNSGYLQPLLYQPPMAARLGMEFRF